MVIRRALGRAMLVMLVVGVGCAREKAPESSVSGTKEQNAPPVKDRDDKSREAKVAEAQPAQLQAGRKSAPGTVRSGVLKPDGRFARIGLDLKKISASKLNAAATGKNVPPPKVSPRRGGSPLLGKRAPDINVALLGGGRFRLRNHRSKNIVVLDFWATTCGPCVRELPTLIETVADFKDDGVILRSIDVEEEKEVVRKFVKNRKLKMTVPLDGYGKVADAYGVTNLPTLVVIDKQGIVRSVHVGTILSLTEVLGNELDALVAGRPLRSEIATEVAAVSDGGVSNEPSLKNILLNGNRSPVKIHEKSDYRMVLESGRVIDIGEIFWKEGEAFEKRLKAISKKKRFLQVNHNNNKKNPFLLISRRGKNLNGPTASFYEDGSPSSYLNFKRGDKTATQFTWDQSKRPLVFEQYKNGKRHGLRCIFKSCGAGCQEGHIWLVQEWSHGALMKAHVVPTDGKPVTFECRNGKTISQEGRPQEEMMLAMAEIEHFETKSAADEEKLKQGLANLHRRESQAARARSNARGFSIARQRQASIITIGSGFGSGSRGGGSRIGSSRPITARSSAGSS